MKKSLGLAALCVIVVAGLSTPASARRSFDSRMFPPDSDPYGTSYAAWEGAYQVWYNEIPTPDSPYVNPDSPFNCEVQDEVVAFLGASGADCTIPPGAAVAFTTYIGFWECSTAEGLGDTYPQLRHCARHNFGRDIEGLLHQRITLDGERIKNLWHWVFLTPGEMIDFPEDNVWGAEPGPSKSVTKGFFFMLQPLSEGDHTIRAKLRHPFVGTLRFVWKLHVESSYPS